MGQALHPNKSKRWVIARYFGMFNPARRDKWVFGSRHTGFYLRKFAWTPIVRHRMVAGTASPDDPSLTDYWAQRRRRSQPPLGTATLRLLRAQHGRCPLCRGLLLHADHEPQTPREWEQWLTATRKAIRKHAVTAGGRHTGRTRPRSVSYTPTATADSAATTQRTLLASPRGLLEPVARKAGTAGSEGAPAQQLLQLPHAGRRFHPFEAHGLEPWLVTKTSSICRSAQDRPVGRGVVVQGR